MSVGIMFFFLSVVSMQDNDCVSSSVFLATGRCRCSQQLRVCVFFLSFLCLVQLCRLESLAVCGELFASSLLSPQNDDDGTVSVATVRSVYTRCIRNGRCPFLCLEENIRLQSSLQTLIKRDANLCSESSITHFAP